MPPNCSECYCTEEKPCICDKDSDGNKLWNDICCQFDDEKKSIQKYILENSKYADAPTREFENKI